jgi:hypothetical protein
LGLWVLAAAPLSAQIHVRDALSYSFASGLVAWAHGDRIAWHENRQGVRSVWVSEGPEWRGRPLTGYDADEVHGFLLHRSWVTAFEASLDFLNRKLRDGGR